MLKAIGLFHPPHLRLLIASSLALNLLALALPMMTMQIYNRVLTNHAIDTLLVLSTGVLIASLFEMILRICRSMLVGTSGAAFEHEATVEAFTRLMHTEPRKQSGVPTATLAQDIASAQRLKEYYGGQMTATLLVDLPFVAVFFGLIVYLSGWLALIPTVMLAFFGYASWKQGSSLNSLMKAREEEDNRRYGFIAQALAAVHTLKASCLEARMTRHFEEVQHESASLNYRIAVLQGATSTFSYTTAQVMTVLVITAGAPMVINGYLSIGALVASVLLSGQIMQPLQRGLALWVKFQEIVLARQRLGAMLDMPVRPWLTIEETHPNHGSLKLEGVRFSHVEGHPVLDGLSLDVAPGEAIAITGASGSGKTTLLELIAGVYAPDRGRVIISGMDAWRIPSDIRSHYLAYLQTKGMILRGSIRENMSGFDPRQQQQARSIAELLGVEQAVALLPPGYDTPLEGLATDVIPPGLKQRIAITRALLHRPRLILYDNADQGLDRDSYGMVFDLLLQLKGKATLILVSEDKNILSLSDRVLELRRGSLVPVMEPSHLIVPRPFQYGAAT